MLVDVRQAVVIGPNRGNQQYGDDDQEQPARADRQGFGQGEVHPAGRERGSDDEPARFGGICFRIFDLFGFQMMS